MSELPSPTLPVVAPPEAGGTPLSPAPAAGTGGGLARHGRPVVLAALALLLVISLATSWRAQQRVRAIEQELVARQRVGSEQAAEARRLAQQAQELARDAQAKTALLETRLAEVLAQRRQLDDLIAAASRPRDESLVSEIDGAVRTALQQASVSGSAEPLVLALRQAEERLGRVSMPRLEPLRRAIGRDLERVRAGGSADAATLTARIDEAIRVIDELPLLSAGNEASGLADRTAPRPGPGVDAGQGATASPTWWSNWVRDDFWRPVLQGIWSELRSLIRVTRIDNPHAMLLAPEQAFFLRENLKLRLLNARVALLTRQFDGARADLLEAERWLQRYFDSSSRRTRSTLELLREVAAQARSSAVRADDTLAALTAAAAATR